MSVEEVVTTAGSIAGDDVFATPEVATPPATPEAHRAKINAVTFEQLDNDKQSANVTVSLTSTDVPTLDQDLKIWLPRLFVTNFADFVSSDPDVRAEAVASLPEVEGNNQRMQYRLGIANSTKDATIQSLLSIAEEAGRSAAGLKRPETIEDYVGNLSAVLTGVSCVVLRNPDKKNEEPKFRNVLRTTRIVSESVINKPKALKNYRKLWEESLQ